MSDSGINLGSEPSTDENQTALRTQSQIHRANEQADIAMLPHANLMDSMPTTTEEAATLIDNLRNALGEKLLRITELEGLLPFTTNELAQGAVNMVFGELEALKILAQSQGDFSQSVKGLEQAGVEVPGAVRWFMNATDVLISAKADKLTTAVNVLYLRKAMSPHGLRSFIHELAEVSSFLVEG